MSDVEVIEIGEDGSFDIPSQPQNTRTRATSYESDAYLGSSNSERGEISLRQSIVAGEYKIFRKENKIFVVLRMLPGENMSDVSFVDSSLNITTTDKVYSINIPSSITVNPTTSNCKVWTDFVTVSFDIAMTWLKK